MRVKLKDIALFSKGKQINGEDLIDNGRYDFLNGGINPSGRWNEYNVEGNSITISEGGNSCGYVNYMANPFWCGAHCYYLYDLKYDSKYIYYALKSQQDRVMQLRSGACMPNIKKNDLAEFEFSIDMDPERQADAVTSLNRVFELIALRQTQLTKLDQLVKSRFVEMFGDTVSNPMNWKKSALGIVCDVRDGTHDSPTYHEVGIPLVTSKNVTGGKIDLSGCSLISESDYEKINERSKVDWGDIVMPMIGTVGNPVIVDINPHFAIKNVSLIKFYPNSRVLNVYVKALLESDYFDTAVLSRVRGGTQKFIALGDIRKLEILVPDMAVQKQFAAFVEQTNKSKLTIQASLDKLELLKKSLMQQYFG